MVENHSKNLSSQKKIRIKPFFFSVNYNDWIHDSEKEGNPDEVGYCHFALFVSTMILVGGYWGLTALLTVAKCAYVVKTKRRSMAF